MRLSCLNIEVDSITFNEAIGLVETWLKNKNQNYVVTPNPEMVVQAQKDFAFSRAIARSSLALPDGIGLIIACTILGTPLKERITGVDFLEKILEKFSAKSFFLLGGRPTVTDKVTQIYKEKFGTNIVGTFSPDRGTYEYTNEITILDPKMHETVIKNIRQSSPEILVVALGHGQQEKWMEKFLTQCPSVKVAIGVGGALDYLGGSIYRAPKIMRAIGTEWLWRLIREPRRLGRIFNATVRFPLMVIVWIFSSHFLYRKSVVGCIINERNKILLVERKDEPGHWQLPQGGQNPGESGRQAVLRETEEEIGIRGIKILGQSKRNIYRYVWGKERYENKEQGTVFQRKYGFKGQAQTIFYLRFNGYDEEIRLDQIEHTNWRWVSADHLLNELHPVRRKLGQVVLEGLNKYV